MREDGPLLSWIWRQKQRMISLRRIGTTVMFHIGRSGSTVLANLLKQHPSIVWEGEIYEAYFRRHERLSGTTFAPTVDSARPLQILARRQYLGGAGWYGFEAKFFHLRLFSLGLEDYISQLKSLGVSKFIILERKNYLRKIVSSAIAHSENRFHMASTAESEIRSIAIDPTRVTIDRTTDSLLSLMRQYYADFYQLRSLLNQQRVLELTYEEDIDQNPMGAYNKILQFLDLEYYPAEVTLSKTNPYPLSCVISNYRAIEECLADTEFSWMLSE